MKTAPNVLVRWGWVLAVTLVVAWFAPDPQDDGVALSSRTVPAPTPPQQSISSTATMQPTNSGMNAVATKSNEKLAATVQVLKIRDRSYSEDEEISVFGRASWERTSAAVTAHPTELPPSQPPPAIPTAPALPFRVMGHYEDDGKSVVFLLQGDQSWVIRVGDTFAETYKVERIASNEIHLRYLPLDEVQVLEIGVAR